MAAEFVWKDTGCARSEDCSSWLWQWPLVECATLCVHWHTGIPFPLVSVARLLLQDFWTVLATDYLALTDTTGNTVPIVRQGTLVFLDTWEVNEPELKLIRCASVAKTNIGPENQTGE